MTKIAGFGFASGSGSINQRHGSADLDPDPDPPQNVMDPQHWLNRSKLESLVTHRHLLLLWLKFSDRGLKNSYWDADSDSDPDPPGALRLTKINKETWFPSL